jgi:hypothetical protein
MVSNAAEILKPLLALAGWTGVVLFLVPLARVRAARRREVRVNDFKFGESASVPLQVGIPNRNYMNLLEAPILFYVVGLLLFVTAGSGPATVALAWAYVALRVVHSLIHLSYNHVLHRLVAFVLSNGVLIALWVAAGTHIAGLSAAA